MLYTTHSASACVIEYCDWLVFIWRPSLYPFPRQSRSIKVATLNHTPAQALSNICKVIPAVAYYTKGGWDNIQSLMLKTSTSVSLPIWSCDLNERWTELMQNEEEKEKVHKTQANGKRPVQEGESEESEKPRKKVKSEKEGNGSVVSSRTELATKFIKNDQQAQPVVDSSTVHQTKESDPAVPSTEPQLKSSGLKRKRVDAASGKKDKVVSAKAGLQRKSVKTRILGKRALQAWVLLHRFSMLLLWPIIMPFGSLSSHRCISLYAYLCRQTCLLIGLCHQSIKWVVRV